MTIYTDSSDLQNCPAAVDMCTGDIYINEDVWPYYTDSEKQFIIQHEMGHYRQNTDSEIESDLYALRKNFGKYHKSLKSAFTSLEKAGVRSRKRLDALYLNALSIDAENGGERAERELKRLQLSNKYKSEMKSYSKVGAVNFGTEEVRKKMGSPRYYLTGSNRADGCEMKDYLRIGDTCVSYTNLLLAAISVILLFKLK